MSIELIKALEQGSVIDEHGHVLSRDCQTPVSSSSSSKQYPRLGN